MDAKNNLTSGYNKSTIAYPKYMEVLYYAKTQRKQE